MQWSDNTGFIVIILELLFLFLLNIITVTNDMISLFSVHNNKWMSPEEFYALLFRTKQ